MKPSEILRMSPVKQIHGKYADEQGMCAMGVLRMHHGVMNRNGVFVYDTIEQIKNFEEKIQKMYREISKKGGGSDFSILALNDEKRKSFLEIADELDKYGY